MSPWLLAWLLAQPSITAPIVGTTKLNQLDDVVAALSLRPSKEGVAEIEAPYMPRAVVGHS